MTPADHFARAVVDIEADLLRGDIDEDAAYWLYSGAWSLAIKLGVEAELPSDWARRMTKTEAAA